MKIERIRPFSKDKKVRFIGFRNGRIFEVESRWLWCEILIKEIHCDSCGSEDRITVHTKDISKLIRILQKMKKNSKEGRK